MTYTAEELERKEGMPKNDFAFCWWNRRKHV